MIEHEKFRAEYIGPEKEKVLFDPVSDIIVKYDGNSRILDCFIHVGEIDFLDLFLCTISTKSIIKTIKQA